MTIIILACIIIFSFHPGNNMSVLVTLIMTIFCNWPGFFAFDIGNFWTVSIHLRYTYFTYSQY